MKIQIFLNAWPHIKLISDKETIVYRLNTDIIFKSEEDEIDLKSEIENIKSLAQEYSSNPTKDSLENLAEQSTNIEQAFNNNPYKSAVKCENVMTDLFGSENRRETQKMLLQEIDFFEGDNFEAKIRLEMCDECEWHGINMNMWFESRGRFNQPEENKNYNSNSREKYSSFTNEDFEKETKNIISDIKSNLENKDYPSAMNKMGDLRMITEAWNEKSNNVWQEVESKFKVDFESMSQEEREECSKNYCWIKKDQEGRKAQKELQTKNYEQRKQFYLNLFSGYDKKESSFSQEQWERRLFEQFKEFGEEICSNNIDDNNNQQIDCGETQCGGKVCGFGEVTITDENNQTTKQKKELYCIANTCQAKEEIVEVKEIICGNNICEENETETCSTDCAMCVQHESLECSGTVLFSGQDANSCPLAPVCLTEDLSCETDDDCADPLCGDSSCIEGTCQLSQLTECREAECTDGEKKVQNCNSGEEITIETCLEGIWIKTDLECSISSETQSSESDTEETDLTEIVIKEEVVGNICTVRSDCGNENDVCSNGNCVTLPEAEIIELSDISSEEQETSQETEREDETETTEQSQDQEETLSPEQENTNNENGEPPTITGNAVSNFFKSLISGFQIEGEGESSSQTSGGESSSSGGENSGNEGNTQLSPEQGNPGQFSQSPPNEENQEDRERENREREDKDRERREREENERREKECAERCDRECYDRETRPYTENCIRKECGQELECDIDEVKLSCEEKAKSETDVASCTTDCSTKCLKGENTWVEPEKQENKQEKFVFTVGGSCRQEREKLQENIWFGGWGDEFKDFHLVKEKYYSYGGADWCKREYESLIKQRKELEKSLNEEFASWFFEKYVASSAENWEKHISGIFEIYWRDVDLSRQLIERSQCLEKKELPPYNLINFKYETDYGSIEFWEEIKTAKIFDDSEEMEIISPYMRTYLFPSRDFFKLEMRKAMEDRRIPGPSEEESINSLTDEQKNNLIDEGFLDKVKSFNEKFGENLVIQFKDYATEEIVFNVYIKINEEDLIYFEPMPYSEVPAEDVKVEIDIEKLLDIIEYSESGRVELQSPPWDKQPPTGMVKGVIDGVKMYFMFKSMLNSAVTTPESAEPFAKQFTRLFFETIMGGDENREKDSEFDEENQEEDEDIEQRDPITGNIINY